ncbi:MAG: D-alanyl-D-alanine carboxypeptidase family protein [Clostridiales bacterium]|nr:D-alanyl-D-alanine carboxypeptidase family protein [Clostridiales bacterium]
MIKRLIGLCLAAMMLFGAANALAQSQPEWEYPLAPEILKDPGDYIILTNTETLLGADYIPDDLVRVTAKKGAGGEMELRKAANDALNAMFAAAEEDGYTLYVKSVYRSYQTQKTMYYNRLDRYGYDDGLVAFPGSSDHQTGLGVDILNYEWTQKDGMNEKFAAEAEAKWMEQNCHRFGFILRYMEDKEEVTNIKYEPWHFRYVGLEAAAYIMENHLSLEEFTWEWQAYIEEYERNGGDFEELLRERARINYTVIEVTEDGEEELSIYY